jgi:hypothetical protein
MSEATGTATRKKTTKINETKELVKMATKKTFNVTKTEEPITFDVDGEEFEAIPADRLPAGALATYFANINAGDLFKAHDAFFETVLTEDSYKRFSDRLNSKESPITVSVLGDIAAWLLGDEYMGGKATEEPKQ